MKKDTEKYAGTESKKPHGNLFVNTRWLANKSWGLIVTLRVFKWGKQFKRLHDVVEFLLCVKARL
jgi:hypothetical protein